MRQPNRLSRFYPSQTNKTANGQTRAWLYLITDGNLLDSDTSAALLKKIEGALKGGVRLVQLREKSLTEATRLKVALKLRELTSTYNAGLIINSSVEVALKCGANGVHLAQTGLNISAARKALGAEALIGVSTHSVEEACKAQEHGADFITFGPVYFTESKARFGKPAGIAKLKEAAAQISIPVFGLGGIGPAHIKEVLKTGATGIGMISAIFNRPDTHKATQEIVTLLQKDKG